MGGSVGVTILKNNGERISMNRWTNILPYFFRQASLYKGEEEKWIKDFCAQWEEMKKDYEDNKDTGKFKHNMTDVYFPYDTLSPVEYGLVVVDFPNKKIYNSQDYTSLNKLYAHSIRKRYYNNSNDEGIKKENEEGNKEFKALFDNGFIKKINYYNHTEEKYLEQDISNLTWSDIDNFLDEINNIKLKKYSHPELSHISKDERSAFSINFFITSDWDLINYKEDNILLMKEDLEKSGIVFSQKDNAAWEKHCSHLFWCEEHDEELKENPDYAKYIALYEKMFNKKWQPNL